MYKIYKFLMIIFSLLKWPKSVAMHTRPPPTTIEKLVSFATIYEVTITCFEIPPTLICLTSLIGPL